MKILHTVETYYPAPGGAGIAVRAVSEELARKGHEVTVATGFSPRRNTSALDGVTIEQFKISGNAVTGYKGDIQTYQNFLRSRRFDVVLNYAAQTWASDLAFPILDSIAARKVFAPCGYSRLRSPAYKRYYEELPAILRRATRTIPGQSGFSGQIRGDFLQAPMRRGWKTLSHRTHFSRSCIPRLFRPRSDSAVSTH